MKTDFIATTILLSAVLVLLLVPGSMGLINETQVKGTGQLRVIMVASLQTSPPPPLPPPPSQFGCSDDPNRCVPNDALCDQGPGYYCNEDCFCDRPDEYECSSVPGQCIPTDTACPIDQFCNESCGCEQLPDTYECSSDSDVCSPSDAMCGENEICDLNCQCRQDPTPPPPNNECVGDNLTCMLEANCILIGGVPDESKYCPPLGSEESYQNGAQAGGGQVCCQKPEGKVGMAKIYLTSIKGSGSIISSSITINETGSGSTIINLPAGNYAANVTPPTGASIRSMVFSDYNSLDNIRIIPNKITTIALYMTAALAFGPPSLTSPPTKYSPATAFRCLLSRKC